MISEKTELDAGIARDNCNNDAPQAAEVKRQLIANRLQ